MAIRKTIVIDVMNGGLEKFVKNFREFESKISNVNNSILNDIAEVGLNEIQQSVSSSNYEDTDPLSIVNEKEKNSVTIGIRGTQAIYDEFGTGTRGEMFPHEEKEKYNLNDYNSGKKIKINSGINSKGNDISNASKEGIPLNGMYWIYNFNGKPKYTQGRPAGMHVYKAQKKLRTDLEKIIDKRMEEALSKL